MIYDISQVSYTKTAASLPLFYTARTDYDSGHKIDSDKTKRYLLILGLTMWKSIGDKRFNLKVLRKDSVGIFGFQSTSI